MSAESGVVWPYVIGLLVSWAIIGVLGWKLFARSLADRANTHRPRSYGQFVGEVVTQWLANGRDMQLLADFVYIDPAGTPWLAPNGSVVNGASIPRSLWSLIGGPFEGRYRNASVIHDVACEARTRPWEEVHRAFYFACLCGGVSEERAAELYAGVYWKGPRWELEKKQVEKRGLVVTVDVAEPIAMGLLTDDDVASIKRFVSGGRRSPAEIEAWVNAQGH